MKKQVIRAQYNPHTGEFKAETQGFRGNACKVVTEHLKSQMGGEVTQESPTPEAFLETESSQETIQKAQINIQ